MSSIPVEVRLNKLPHVLPRTPQLIEQTTIVSIVLALHLAVLYPALTSSHGREKHAQEMKVTLVADNSPVSPLPAVPAPVKVKPPVAKPAPKPLPVEPPVKQPEKPEENPVSAPPEIEKTKLEQEAALAKAREEAEAAQRKVEQEAEKARAEKAAAQAKAQAEIKAKVDAELARLQAMQEAKKLKAEREAAEAKVQAEAKAKSEAEAARLKEEQEAARARAEAKARAEAEAARRKAEQEVKLAKEKAEAEEVVFKALYNQKNARPSYPLAARRMGLQGKVLLNVEVLADGSCGKINIAQSSGHRILDQNALDTVKTWEFIPARQAGVAISRWYQVPIVFSLKDN